MERTELLITNYGPTAAPFSSGKTTAAPQTRSAAAPATRRKPGKIKWWVLGILFIATITGIGIYYYNKKQKEKAANEPQ